MKSGQTCYPLNIMTFMSKCRLGNWLSNTWSIPRSAQSNFRGRARSSTGLTENEGLRAPRRCRWRELSGCWTGGSCPQNAINAFRSKTCLKRLNRTHDEFKKRLRHTPWASLTHFTGYHFVNPQVLVLADEATSRNFTGLPTAMIRLP